MLPQQRKHIGFDIVLRVRMLIAVMRGNHKQFIELARTDRGVLHPTHQNGRGFHPHPVGKDGLHGFSLFWVRLRAVEKTYSIKTFRSVASAFASS